MIFGIGSIIPEFANASNYSKTGINQPSDGF